ncbi:solute carrier family 35 member F5 isoform X3 [Dendroctonus ponderosae]|uniref:EamA domain-containing protein n=1 Tax=Dendroctonus ponderosae TaxID=77166 RepID=A0AAR5QFJ7_DENPD|nr:solute carrier family 35 member F5 isoform X3 [Dendroctonus ponderosae]
MDSGALTVLTKSQRIVFGLVVLILVDMISVSLSKLTKQIYNEETLEKPFFCTYVKASMFTCYLLGFLCWHPWRDAFCARPNNYDFLDSEPEEDHADEAVSGKLSTPIFVPVKLAERDSLDKSSGTESDDSSLRYVRFSKVAEVRHLSEVEAADALLARLSYQASMRAGEIAKRATLKLPVEQVAKIALIFCLLVSLLKTQAGLVNLLSSTSSFFTLLLASIYPSSTADKFTISKLAAVILSILGVLLLSLSDIKQEANIPTGAVLGLVSAVFYAAYLVFLKRTVPNGNRIDIPMFFGFVGLFNLLLMWPLFVFLHITKIETFEWPNREQLTLLLLNGLLGTVVSEALWLWGCFLTSSLMATVATSMAIPIAFVADAILKHLDYSPLFYLGTIFMILGFLLVTAYTHFEKWDPVASALRCAYAKACRRTMSLRSGASGVACEQRESLMTSNTDSD